MNTKHTPFPWHIEKSLNRFEIWPVDNGQTHTFVGVVQRAEDSEFIVRACNSHDELVAACERALPWIGKMIADKAHLNSVAPNDCVGAMEQLEAALAKDRIYTEEQKARGE